MPRLLNYYSIIRFMIVDFALIKNIIMLPSFLRRSSPPLLTRHCCTFAQDKLYIPIRPLRQDRNVLYTIGQPHQTPLLYRIFTLSPLFGFILEGVTYEWNALAWGGSLLGLYLAVRWNNMLMFNKAHECYQIAVNRNMTKYQFLVYNNLYAKKWERALLKNQNKSYEQAFIEKLKNGTLLMPEEDIQRLKSYEPQVLSKAIAGIYRKRRGIHLELSQAQIKSFQFVSRKMLTQKIKKNFRETMGSRSSSALMEDYDTEKEVRDILMIESKKINGETIILYGYLQNNLDKKLEEYLKALAEGKSIVNI